MAEPNFVSLEHSLGRRISIRGDGGKTTLAHALSLKTGLPHIELDALSYLLNWQQRSESDFRKQVKDALNRSQDGWIADGNYVEATHDLTLSQAETVIWLDLPFRVMFRRMIKRTVIRLFDRETMCGENKESWRRTFSKNSLWLYYLRNRSKFTGRGERFLPFLPEGVPIVRIRSGKELNEFYKLQELLRS